MDLSTLKSKLHKYERKTVFVADLFGAIYLKLQELEDYIQEVKKQFFFDTVTFLLSWYEELLGITPRENADIDERRSTVRARWRASGKNTLKLIRGVCESWKNGEVEVSFEGGKIKLNFVGAYGIPDDMTNLMKTLEEVKPAHIGYSIVYKYLLIEDIHEVLKLEELEELRIEEFAGNREGEIMSSTTTNLSLFKYDTVADSKAKFNIDTALNDNFDKIDTFAGNVNTNKANIDLSNLSATGQ